MDHLSSLFSRKCVILTHKCESVIVTQPLVTVVSCWRKSISVVGLKVDQNNASSIVPMSGGPLLMLFFETSEKQPCKQKTM